MKFFQHRQTPVFSQRAPGMVLLVLALSLIAVSLTSCGAQQQARQQAAGIANPSFSPTSSPAFSHIFTIVLENKEYTTIIGKSDTPYLNSLVSIYGLATQYYAIGHPSLPNYMALTGGSTFGITSDCTTCFQHAQNLADQIEASGRSWKAYMENMPSPCYIGDSPDGLYVQKHNPFLYYDMICTIVLLLLEIPGFPRSCPAFSTQLLLSRVECFSSPLTKGKRVLAVAMMQLEDRSQRW